MFNTNPIQAKNEETKRTGRADYKRNKWHLILAYNDGRKPLTPSVTSRDIAEAMIEKFVRQKATQAQIIAALGR